MSIALDRTLKTIFDQSALDYDAVRPGYPEELIEDIIASYHLPEGGRILEVGCGTGQATMPFAKQGYTMVCLDIGAELAAIAREKCQAYPNVTIHTTPFEDWHSKPEIFDLMISATAFHWIPPEIGYPKVASILKDSGYMAIFRNYHPGPYTGFFEAVDKIYQTLGSGWGRSKRPSTEEYITSTVSDIKQSELFEEPLVKRYAWSREYTAEDYIKLLNTYSDHRNLEPQKRERLFSDIKQFIEKEYAGSVTRPYLAVLYLAKKRQT